VKIHGTNPEILIKAHSYLGEAYHLFKCPDQAYEHLTVARERNETQADSESKQDYQLYILRLLAINRLQDGKADEALRYIEEAENICRSRIKENNQNAEAFKDLAEVKRYHGEYFAAKKQFQDAIDCYKQVADLYRESVGENTEGEAKAMKSIYRVNRRINDLEQALDYLQTAIRLYEHVESADNKSETLINLYMEKLDLLQECTLETEEERDEHIKECYIKIKELNMNVYGETDKRTLKALRNLVIFLTRKKQVDEALENLEIVEKVELGAFGGKSKQIAKTYSLKATLYLRNGDKSKAREFFRRSEDIYKELGDQQSAKKTHEKLLAINKD